MVAYLTQATCCHYVNNPTWLKMTHKGVVLFEGHISTWAPITLLSHCPVEIEDFELDAVKVESKSSLQLAAAFSLYEEEPKTIHDLVLARKQLIKVITGEPNA